MSAASSLTVEPTQPEIAFVMDGRDDNVDTLSTMERYETFPGEWSAATNMGTHCHSFGACAVLGKIFVTGGRDEEESPLSSVEMYSPASEIWSLTCFLSEPRSAHAAVAVGSTMHVPGGIVEADGAVHVTASVLKLDSMQGTWNVVAPMPEPRYKNAACVVGSDIYVFGEMGNILLGQRSIFKYDTETDEWSTLASMAGVDHGISAIELSGLVYIVGAGETTCGLLRYDPAIDTWILLW
jgi:hypothetical protein